jgi:hypothetical protein
MYLYYLVGAYSKINFTYLNNIQHRSKNNLRKIMDHIAIKLKRS